jgi:eukaryotic-like serine/threonine-protein kinase
VPSDSDASYSMNHLLFVRQGTLLAQRFNLKTLTTEGEPLPVATDVDYVAETGRASFGTGGGVLTYFSTRRAITRLVMFSRGGDRLSDGSSPGFYADFNIVGNGQYIVFGRQERPDVSSGDLWLLNVARNTETRLVSGLRLNSRVLRGTDNDVLIGTSEGDWAKVARHDLKGGIDVQDVLQVKGNQIWDVSQDGRLVLFSRNRNLWLRSADGSERLVVQGAGTQLATPTLNPTGEWLLYLSNETGRSELYARDIVGTLGRERLSPEGAVDPNWSRDGHEVFFRGLDGSFFVLPITGSGRDAKFGRPLRLFPAQLPFAGSGRSYVVLPNGNFLLKTLADDVAARSSIVVLNWTAALKK